MNDCFVGIDVGATNIKCVLFDICNNKVIRKQTQSFEECDTLEQEIEKNVLQPIAKIIMGDAEIFKVIGIGITTGALFDRQSLSIVNWPNHNNWNGYALAERVRDTFKCIVVMEEDANAAAMGEKVFGAAQKHKSFAYMTISTGIGCGLILNGELYIGSSGFAGEIGHIPISNQKVKCKCGSYDCFQALASGKAILEQAKRTPMRSKSISCLSEISEEDYDSLLDEILEQAARYIAQMTLTLIMILDLPMVVLGGGVISNNNKIRTMVEEQVNRHLYQLGRSVELRISNLGEYNGVLGMLNLLYEHAFQKQINYFNLEDGDSI